MVEDRKHNPFIDWKEIAGKRVLYFEFEGEFNKLSAIKTIERCEKLIVENSPQKTIMVFNCLNMTGYNTSTSNSLYDKIQELKKDIHSMHTIVNSPLIMAATEIISFFSKFKIKYYSSVEKLERELNDKKNKVF